MPRSRLQYIEISLYCLLLASSRATEDLVLLTEVKTSPLFRDGGASRWWDLRAKVLGKLGELRPARYLNGVKLEEYEVVNIVRTHTKDQYDID